MRIDDLIEQLTAIRREHGNLRVGTFRPGYGDVKPPEISFEGVLWEDETFDDSVPNEAGEKTVVIDADG